MKRARSVACLAACTLLPACAGPKTAAPDDYGSWMKLPPDEWPKLAVVNQITYADQRYPIAGCGFLLSVGDETFAATAKHVLTHFKSAKMDAVDFAGTLETWTMFPKDDPAAVIVVGELVNRDAEESLERVPCAKDWLLFSVRERSASIQPLRARTTPLVGGEQVCVVGWRYTERDCRQKFYEGFYVGQEPGAVLITVPELIDNTTPGLSGAPVIDAQGYVVGMMSRGKGRIQRLSPVAYPLEVLARRDR